MIPATSLPPEAVPWGRAVNKRLEQIDARMRKFLQTSKSEYRGRTSELDSITQQVRRYQLVSEWWQDESSYLAGQDPAHAQKGQWVSHPRASVTFTPSASLVRVQAHGRAGWGTGRLSFSVNSSSPNPLSGQIEDYYPRSLPVNNESAPWFSDEMVAGMQVRTIEALVSTPQDTEIVVTVEAYCPVTNPFSPNFNANGLNLPYSQIIVESVE